MSISSSVDFSCNRLLFERKIDCCQLNERVLNSMFVNIFLKDIIRAANFKLKCPYRAGHYDIVNLSLSFPPTIPLPKNTNVCITKRYFGKTSGSKKFVQILTMRSFITFNEWLLSLVSLLFQATNLIWNLKYIRVHHR